MNSTTEVNHEKLMELFGNVFNDVAGSMAIMMSYLGDQAGYRNWPPRCGQLSERPISHNSHPDGHLPNRRYCKALASV